MFILHLTNVDNGERKQERRRKSMYVFFRKSPAPSENRFVAILSRKEPGFEPGLLGQNATALLYFLQSSPSLQIEFREQILIVIASI